MTIVLEKPVTAKSKAPQDPLIDIKNGNQKVEDMLSGFSHWVERRRA